MTSLYLWHWIIVVIAFLAVVVPIAKILRKAGYTRWWVILFLIPAVNLVALWVFALSRWPALENVDRREFEELKAMIRRLDATKAASQNLP